MTLEDITTPTIAIHPLWQENYNRIMEALERMTDMDVETQLQEGSTLQEVGIGQHELVELTFHVRKWCIFEISENAFISAKTIADIVYILISQHTN